MAKVRLRTAADADLAEILAFGVETFGENVGEAYVGSFQQAVALLERHPLAGTLRADLDPPIHCLHHRRHRIFYDIEGDTVWIVRVLHHAMDESSRLDR